MTRDPPSPADDADRELSSLFATLKDDQAPPDLEARLLEGLAATAAASAGAAAVKGGLGHKIALWLGTSGLGKSMLVGALCGGAVCGAIAVVDRPPDSAPPATEVSPGARVPDLTPPSGAGAGSQNKPHSEEVHPPFPRAATPVAAASGDGEARAPAPVSAAPGSAGAPGGAAEPAPEPSPGAEPAAGTPTPAPSPSPATSGSAASDELRRELLHVRGISALVDAGRCPEARAAIAAYRGAHRTGQLAGEVDVLAARCQGR